MTGYNHVVDNASAAAQRLQLRACAFRGERDKALDWLERAYETRDVDLDLNRGRSTVTRCKAFLRRVNLP